MGLYINTNVPSLVAQRNLGNSQKAQAKAMERLSTGMRINRASDDSTGLAMSEKFKAEIRSLGQAKRNAGDGISMLQTAESSLETVGDTLIRLRELAVGAANGTLTDTQRLSSHQEFKALRAEIDRVAGVTKFAGITLLDGSANVDLQVGKDSGGDNVINVTIADSQTTAIGGDISTLSVSTAAKAGASLTSLDTAISDVTTNRATIGAGHNRLMSAITNLETTIENLSVANSAIREIDVASETAELTRTQILMQAGVSVLAQANQSPQMALSLIG